MDKTTKTILIIVVVILGLGMICCVGGFFFFQVGSRLATKAIVIDDPEKIMSIADDYVDFTLPEGYVTYGGINMGVMRMALFVKESDLHTWMSSPIIIIAGVDGMDEVNQTPPDLASIKTRMESMMMNITGQQGITMELTDTQMGEVNDQPIELYIFEGYDEDGNPMKSLLTGNFTGKNEHQVLVFFLHAGEGWNQALVDQFLDSIH